MPAGAAGEAGELCEVSEIIMKLFYSNDAEGCILEGEKLDLAPIKLGQHTVKVGTCIRYMGDGRPHRSFEMVGDYTLEYSGMLRFGENNEFNRILFSVYGFNYLKDNNLFYSFVYVDDKMLWLIRGNLGGMRDILLKKVEIVKGPVTPKQIPQQLSLFSYINKA